MRPSGRAADQLREISFDLDVNAYAEGSCLIRCGRTHVLCTASVSEKVPSFLRGTGQGWVTAEYGMLPRATHERTDREAAKGKQTGRTQEIQRLIGRALRAVVDRKALGEMQIKIDCDVLQADGGTRTASITGGYIALALALRKLEARGRFTRTPLLNSVAAISCGIYKGQAVLDLDYPEDSNAQADANFVLTGTGGLIEVQGTAEQDPIEQEQFDELMKLARKGLMEIAALQKQVLEEKASCAS